MNFLKARNRSERVEKSPIIQRSESAIQQDDTVAIQEMGEQPATPYGNIDLEQWIERISSDRSVHITRAVFTQPVERLALPLKSGAKTLILSDSPEAADACIQRCDVLSEQFPDRDIRALSINYDDFWQCRSAPKAEVVIDLGHLIHDVAPDRSLLRLSALSTHTLLVTAMVLPPFNGPAGAEFADGDILPATRVRPPSALAAGAWSSFISRGVEIAQLRPEAAHEELSWRWFFSPAGLVRLGTSLGLRATDVNFTWNDLAVAIEFEKAGA